MFSLALDDETFSLNHVKHWVSEMSIHFKSTKLVVTHAKRGHKTKDGIDILVLGGGTIIFRLKAIMKLLSLIPHILLNRKNLVVFHHMTVYPLYILGPLFRFLGIPQGLWYAHGEKALGLSWGALLCNYIFSPTKNSFPLQSSKILEVGHGIELQKKSDGKGVVRKRSILVVGRIAPVKRIEEIIIAMSRLPEGFRSILLIGSLQDQPYYENLFRMAGSLEVKMEYLGPMSPMQLEGQYQSHVAMFSGTRNSVDKVTLEATSHGCFVVTRNAEVHKLLGTEVCFAALGRVGFSNLSIEGQLRTIFSSIQLQEINDCLKDAIYRGASLTYLCSKISKKLKDN